MYWKNLGFKEPPFALTPNPAFLFLSSTHQDAFAHLLFAIENRTGFIELSGEVGTGKTTLVRTLLNQLDAESYRTALIFNPTLSALDLLKEINGEFGLASDGNEVRQLHQALNDFLLKENAAGRTVVLVIDEAQKLSVEVLEQIRLISNLETESDKLIQIVLVGQPELNALLARPELRQLDQRITIRYHLNSMCFADSCDYVRHRIRFAAGGREPVTFSAGALKRIFSFSKGLPRLINSVCDRALLLAYTRECQEISPSMAATSIADLRKETPCRRGHLRPLLGSAAAAILIAAVFLFPRQGIVEAKKPLLAAAPPLSVERVVKELAAVPQQENLYCAVNSVLSVWQKPPVKMVPGDVATLRGLAAKRGLLATTVSGNLDKLNSLDAPALLHIRMPGTTERVIAVTSIGNDGVGIAPAVMGRSKLSATELRQIWNGEATILWKDFNRLLSREGRAEKAEGVKLLQGLLKEAGCYGGPLNGKPGPMTQKAIAAFQRKEQLRVDGQVGGETLLLLYRRAGGFFPPSISSTMQKSRPS